MRLRGKAGWVAEATIGADRYGETFIWMDGEPYPQSDAEYAGFVAIEQTDEERRLLIANGYAFVVPH
jgi:hypothetical protein